MSFLNFKHNGAGVVDTPAQNNSGINFNKPPLGFAVATVIDAPRPVRVPSKKGSFDLVEFTFALYYGHTLICRQDKTYFSVRYSMPDNLANFGPGSLPELLCAFVPGLSQQQMMQDPSLSWTRQRQVYVALRNSTPKNGGPTYTEIASVQPLIKAVGQPIGLATTETAWLRMVEASGVPWTHTFVSM